MTEQIKERVAHENKHSQDEHTVSGFNYHTITNADKIENELLKFIKICQEYQKTEFNSDLKKAN